MKDKFQETIDYIISVLKDAGYNPYEQLYAFVSTGNDSYITRQGNARTLVAELDRELIGKFIEPHIMQKGR